MPGEAPVEDDVLVSSWSAIHMPGEAPVEDDVLVSSLERFRKQASYPLSLGEVA